MVSAWYENGNVNTYLRKLGDAATVERRLKLVSAKFPNNPHLLTLSSAH